MSHCVSVKHFEQLSPLGEESSRRHEDCRTDNDEKWIETVLPRDVERQLSLKMSIQNNITFSEWFVSSFSSKVCLIYLLMSVHGNTFDCFPIFFSEENFHQTVEGQFFIAL